MSDLAAAAAALGIPEVLAQRSAEARAAETGATVEEILAAWAGGAPAPAASTPSEPSEPAEAAPSTDSEDTTPEIKIEIPEPSKPAIGESPAPAVARSPVPSEVTMAEATNFPIVVTVATTGIKERTNFVLPKWLAGLFLVVPLFALFALGGAATGECGNATELLTDVVTGDIVNCDGSKFEGSSVGGGSTDFIALGESVYQGQAVSGVNCAGCHGAGGGGGAGPALNGVLNVFGACTDHIEWVTLATPGFQAAGRGTYGDTNKPVQGFGVMPGFGSALSAEQIAAVSAFERVRFGGQTPEDALTDCGLAEPPADGTGTEGDPGTTDGTTPETGDSTTPSEPGTDTTTP